MLQWIPTALVPESRKEQTPQIPIVSGSAQAFSASCLLFRGLVISGCPPFPTASSSAGVCRADRCACHSVGPAQESHYLSVCLSVRADLGETTTHTGSRHMLREAGRGPHSSNGRPASLRPPHTLNRPDHSDTRAQRHVDNLRCLNKPSQYDPYSSSSSVHARASPPCIAKLEMSPVRHGRSFLPDRLPVIPAAYRRAAPARTEFVCSGCPAPLLASWQPTVPAALVDREGRCATAANWTFQHSASGAQQNEVPTLDGFDSGPCHVSVQDPIFDQSFRSSRFSERRNFRALRDMTLPPVPSRPPRTRSP